MELVGGGLVIIGATPSSFSQTTKKFQKDNLAFMISVYVLIDHSVSKLKAMCSVSSLFKSPFCKSARTLSPKIEKRVILDSKVYYALHLLFSFYKNFYVDFCNPL